ncbi:RNA-directed DNA polymerase, eukaryota [Tanacetum coccineum]
MARSSLMRLCICVKLRRKTSRLFFKVDFEKAYDTVRWDFLDDVLHKFGFGNKLALCIQSCLRSLVVSIICKRSSGLKINMSKSKIMGIHVEDVKVKQAASKLGCLILNTPFSYLGTKVGGSMSRVHAWDELNMGNGESTTFWEDRWLEGSVLKDIFPRLYVLETNKKVSVGDKLKDFRLDSSFRRKARGGIEQVQYEELSDMVNSISLTPKNDHRYPGGRSRTRWVKYVPIKVNVTAWKIKMDALPTRLNISRRGMDIQSLSCPICDCGVESSSHLNGLIWLSQSAAAYG